MLNYFLQTHLCKRAGINQRCVGRAIARLSSSAKDTADTKSRSSAPRDGSPHSRLQNPIVAQLWEARRERKIQLMSIHDADSDTTGSGQLAQLNAQMVHESAKQEQEGNQPRQPLKEPKFKYPKESRTSVDYPFSTDDYLKAAYCSPGGTMRFGKILEDLDALAGNIAFHHVIGNPLLVTAAVDRIALQQIPTLDKDQRLSGQVTWVGRSSMEIRMQLHEISPEDSGNDSPRENENEYLEDHWLEAYFTFVAVDPDTNKPIKILPILPETSEERALYELGALKAAKKKEDRKRAFSLDGKGMTEEAIQMEKRAKDLLKEAFPLLRMPSLADPNSILVENTILQNSLIAQPQVRNLHDRVFGGFLMRRAFELAFANAYVFGGEWPQMLEVDNITFYSPVDVGDLLQFQSRVIYSLPEGGNLGSEVAAHKGKPLAMIEVECWITEPAKVDARLSNRFYFTFLLPTKKSCRKVLPGSLEEARRMVERMVADEEQSKLTKGYLFRVDREED